MHVYIYDSYLSEKKYESILAKIETRTTDLGLNGKIIRLGVMNSVYNAIGDEIRKGAKTIILVGNIKILNQGINAMANYFRLNQTNRDVPLGFIPVGRKGNEVAIALGTNFDEEACDVISARRIETIDLGLANQEYFITSARITTEKTSVEIDTNYSIEIVEKGEISVVNMPTFSDLPKEINPKINDSVLELVIKTKVGINFLSTGNKKIDNSVFSFKKLKIFNPEKGVILDDSITLTTPVEIKIAHEKINFIVGKNRLF
jgi:hypothetical protein